MKEGIVTKVVQKKDKTGGWHNWNVNIKGVDVIMWTWQVAFDNNDWGEFNVKDGFQPKFVVGESAHYTIEVNKHDPSYPAVVKWANPEYASTSGHQQPSTTEFLNKVQTKGNNTERLIIRQCCIKAAAELYGARSVPQPAESAIVAADVFYNWVIKPETVEAKEIVAGLSPEAKKAIEQEEEDSLPF